MTLLNFLDAPGAPDVPDSPDAPDYLDPSDAPDPLDTFNPPDTPAASHSCLVHLAVDSAVSVG